MKDKSEYLLLNPEQSIPDEYELNKWTNFLPPLNRFHIKNLSTVSDGFLEQLYSDIRKGDYRQLEKLLVVESKIIAFSLALQESIQKLVEKKDLLLKSGSQPFMDNACCNEEGQNRMTALQYFINENNNIQQYNFIVAQLTTILSDVKLLTQSAIMLSEINTKRAFPEISNEFSETTIYEAFIQLCKFQSSLPLTEELASICIDKPNYIRKNDSIQEKVEKLKRDGRKYTKDMFLRLFQIVSRNNIIHIAFTYNTPSCAEGMRQILAKFGEENNEDVSPALTNKLETLLDSYDLTLEQDTKEMRSLKNYLETSNGLMRKELIDFIKKKGRVTGQELNKITRFLDNMMVWRCEKKDSLKKDISISDDCLYNSIQFCKNFISLFSTVFPTMILTQKMQSINPPRYWGLSRSHSDMVVNMVESFYKPIESFYGKSHLKNILYEIQNKTKGILLLSEQTPVLTNIQMGNKEMHSVFDKVTVTLLYEYYILSILNDYIAVTKSPTMLTKLLSPVETLGEQEERLEHFSSDFLIEQQLRFTEEEQEFVTGNVSSLQKDIAKLLIAYMSIMISSKKTVDVSFEDIEDRVFKLKEAEKYTFTDRLKAMSDEERKVDTILKYNKLGPLYSIGLSKGIREYDAENFEHDKMVAEKVAEIQNRLRRNGATDRDLDEDIEDIVNEEAEDRAIDVDNEENMNRNDDYDDGDPWDDEQTDDIDYD
jgi:hypothetical protein